MKRLLLTVALMVTLIDVAAQKKGVLDYIIQTSEEDSMSSLVSAVNGSNSLEAMIEAVNSSRRSDMQSFPLSNYYGAIYTPEWGRITSNFGYRLQFKRMHKGIDIAMNVGDTVRAVLPGFVSKVGYEANGYGHYVVLKHDGGMETRYAHLSRLMVGMGQFVDARNAVGLSGNSGNSTGPHLHFETRKYGVALDPASVFDFTSSFNRVYSGTLERQNETKVFATGFNGSKKSLSDKSTYVVREGDTLKKIAQRAGISAFRLCQLNFITESTPLEPGTMLRLR